jgi:hypothetical protein
MSRISPRTRLGFAVARVSTGLYFIEAAAIRCFVSDPGNTFPIRFGFLAQRPVRI